MIDIFSFVDAASFHMWFVLLLILGAMVAYSSDKIPLELTSIIVFSLLLLFFHLFPLIDESGHAKITTTKLLEGFANPALITVIGLLVVGQAVVQTGALNEVANIIIRLSRNNAIISIVMSLFVVMGTSAILNNTPVVVIFIPILAVLAKNLDISVSKVMIPLSYAAILGGMMTLIGSSTNLLVSGTLEKMGHAPLGFFDFTVPGMFLASVGLVYVIFIAPRLLPDRASFAKSIVGDDDRQFIAQVEIDRESDFMGKEIKDGIFPGFPDITVRMVQRGEHAFLPPFDEDMVLRSRDIVIVAATRKDITELLSKQPSSLLQNTRGGAEVADESDTGEVESDVSMAEVIITPTSRMIGRNLEQVGFYHHYNCVVLGVQRQSRVIRARISEIRLAAGDVLLVMGKRQDIMKLLESKDLLILEWSTEEIHSGKKAKQAAAIFTSVVLLAALDVVPIAVSAFAGATAAIVAGCLNLRQARRAIDSQVVLIVAASLALGVAMQETGGASFIAHGIVELLDGASAITVMSVLFLAIIGVTNILSNNASGVLFTPIAVNAATELGVDPAMFVFAVIFACNCSFITPIGYQTNLLVMGPGHYKFSDFIRSGLPLALIMWLTYTLFAPWYFNVH
jgi:di/tricarboxylate transporter